MRNNRPGLLIFLCSITLLLGFFVFQNEQEKRKIKEDVIELSKVKYGIFNVDEWKKVLSEIVSRKVDEFDLNDANSDEMRNKISTFLYKVVSDFERNYKKKNDGFPLGFLKNAGAEIFGVFSELKNNIPQITEDILDFLNEPENRDQIKNYLLKKLDQYSSETFAEVDYTQHDKVLEKYGYQDRKEAVAGLVDRIDELNEKHIYFYISVFLLILVQTGFLIYKDLSKIEISTLLVLSLVLLIMGLSLPMIDIDARISMMKFTLLGEPIVFTNQVLYYKSKSILEVVQLMFLQGKIELIAVGFLVLLFSVLFPVSKLICSFLILFNKSLKNDPLVKFMVYKTGKWSMADVMILVIFMAYLGFSGILSEQLEQLGSISTTLDMITTNQSTLQLGFYLFLMYVLMSLFLSEKIGRLSK